MSAILLALMLNGVTPSRAVVVTGQSLSEGASTVSAVSIAQVGSNQMPGNQAWTANNEISVPASDWPWVAEQESAINLEHPRAGLANYYRTATGVDLFMIFGGRGGSTYSQMSAGTPAWNYMSYSIESFGARTSGSIIASYNVHGERDHRLGTSRSAYTAILVQWQQDIQTKVRASTASGSAAVVPMYLDQMHSWTSTTTGPDATSVIPLAQYDAARQNPGVIVLVGPKYQYSYQADGTHLINTSSRAMGAQAGKAIAYGTTWQPLWPVCTEFPNPCTTSPVARTAAVITLQLYVPVCPLVFGAAPMTGVSSSTHGFEYTDSSGAGTISSVVSGGACVNHVQPVTITLSADPTGHTAKLLRYAYTGTSGNSAGPTSGVRGDVCDSDPATWQSATLQNCLVTFEESVP